MSGLLRTILLLGALQGFIFSFLLFFSKKNKTPNRLLGVLIFEFALASLKLYGGEEAWFNHRFSHLVDVFIPLIIIMPIGPLLFFYVRSCLDPEFRLTKRDRFHFFPVLIDLVPQLTAILFVAGLLFHALKNDPQPWGRFIDAYNVYSDIPRWLSISIYLWLAWNAIDAWKKQKFPGRESTDRAGALKWLQRFVLLFLVFQGIWLLYLVPYCIPAYTDRLLNSVGWYPVYVPLAVLIYWLGIKGYIETRQIGQVKKNAGVSTPLSSSLVEQVTAALTTAMEKDHLYLSPTLTVASVAMHIEIPQKSISAVLNQHLQKSFNEFVNEYRVKALIGRLRMGEARNLTIAGMAYECGFNSLPTFQRAFKTLIGSSPREYLSSNEFLSESKETIVIKSGIE